MTNYKIIRDAYDELKEIEDEVLVNGADKGYVTSVMNKASSINDTAEHKDSMDRDSSDKMASAMTNMLRGFKKWIKEDDNVF